MNTLYWGMYDSGYNLLNTKPLQNIKEITTKYKIEDVRSNFNKCPSFHQESSKTFNILAPFDYSLKFENGLVKTNFYDQDIFNEFVKIEDINLQLLQFHVGYLFFSENPCNMVMSNPLFSNSEFSQKCNVIIGSFDINKWFRPTHVGFILKKDFNEINIKENDELASLRFDFNNNEKIQLKQFYISDNIYKIINSLRQNRILLNFNFNNYFNNLYDKFAASKLKTLILKEIKNNLMD